MGDLGRRGEVNGNWNVGSWWHGDWRLWGRQERLGEEVTNADPIMEAGLEGNTSHPSGTTVFFHVQMTKELRCPSVSGRVACGTVKRTHNLPIYLSVPRQGEATKVQVASLFCMLPINIGCTLHWRASVWRAWSGAACRRSLALGACLRGPLQSVSARPYLGSACRRTWPRHGMLEGGATFASSGTCSVIFHACLMSCGVWQVSCLGVGVGGGGGGGTREPSAEALRKWCRGG